ncbi:class E sortase, partial [Streptomyces pseudogriseolus]
MRGARPGGGQVLGVTALRPERESGAHGYGAGDQGTSYGGQPYGVQG